MSSLRPNDSWSTSTPGQGPAPPGTNSSAWSGPPSRRGTVTRSPVRVMLAAPEGSGGESLGRPSPSLGRLHLAVAWRCRGAQPAQQLRRGPRHRINGIRERLLVGPGRLTKAADLADVLHRGGVDLLLGGWRIEVVESSDVATHGGNSSEPAKG